MCKRFPIANSKYRNSFKEREAHERRIQEPAIIGVGKIPKKVAERLSSNNERGKCVSHDDKKAYTSRIAILAEGRHSMPTDKCLGSISQWLCRTPTTLISR